MTRGYTSITLKGGKKDGEIIDDVSLRKLPDAISFNSECYFAKSNDGNISIMKGSLSSLWHSYSVHIYSKVENKKHESGTIFEFIETRDVERCSAIIKKKTQCLKPAIYGKSYCSENHNSNKQ
ncbi:hypothetical protein H4J50_10450 [Colwellia sp. 6M3]|uniref:hypothetical protein n=1 Tax=Colwellia sp. 6M3 TaxID=2759849 RepID=UPI0015F6249B|nr:hypothetical protein [Colwellia sp. 6M3]MBA6416434.1 hypothetical protein [Colwellia sp. 6M3]